MLGQVLSAHHGSELATKQVICNAASSETWLARQGLSSQVSWGAFCTSRRTLASYASKGEKQCAVQIQNIRGSKSFFELEKFITNRVHVNVNAQMGPIHNFLSGVIPAWKRIFRIGATRALTFSVEWLISKIGFPKTGFPKTGCPKTGLPRTGRILADFGRKIGLEKQIWEKNGLGKTDFG